MYEGSLVGSGPVVFALWGYCISKADGEDSTVMLNPPLIAQIIGTTKEEIVSAIEFLSSPDEYSKNTEHEGRRLLHVSGFCYYLVSHQHYRAINNMQDVRSYERERKRLQRLKNKDVPDSPGKDGTPVSVYASVSASDNIERPKKRFTIPTVDEVAEYCKERSNNVDAQSFIDFYESKGWIVGKSPMKDWKAAVRTWEKNNFNKPTTKPAYGRQEVSDEAIQRVLNWRPKE
jgi:hypothetical protein